MKGKVLYFIVLAGLFFMNVVSPLFAHDGDDGATVVEGVSSSMPLLITSVIVATMMLGVTYNVPDKQGKDIWKYLIIGLTTLTAIIHLGIGIQGETLLLLNGVGYLGFIGAMLLPIPLFADKQRLLLWGLIGYTAVTFVGYFVIHGVSTADRLGLVTKLIEAFLIMDLLGAIFMRSNKTQEITP